MPQFAHHFWAQEALTANRGKKRDSFQVHEISTYEKKVSFCAVVFICFTFVPNWIIKSIFFFFLSECLLIQIVWDKNNKNTYKVVIGKQLWPWVSC